MPTAADLWQISNYANRRQYELSNHLGNVMAVIGDYVTVENDTIKYPSVFSLNDYYVFGAKKELGNSSTYRYGFNGKENDDEVKGEGNQQDYGMRIYDPRLGKFLSVDPLTRKFAMLTPYQFASNSPISYIDIDGLEGIWYIKAKFGVYGETTAKIINGTEEGVEKAVQGAWKFLSEDAWKKETWIQAADGLGTIADMTFGNLDGRNDQIAYNVINPVVDDFKKNVVKGDAYTRSKYFSEFGTEALIGALTTKGGGLLKNAAMGAVRRNLAASFYSKVGFSIEKAMQHMEGIDFTKPVQTTTLKKGTIVQQWVGENGIGNNFTPLDNGSAKNLGISYEGRILKSFELVDDVKVLKSTPADYKGHTGGGIQLFSPDFKNKIIPTTKEP